LSELFIDGLSPARRLVGGAVAGAAAAFIIATTRMLGAFAEEDESE
jgi:hypothetical protein